MRCACAAAVFQKEVNPMVVNLMEKDLEKDLALH